MKKLSPRLHSVRVCIALGAALVLTACSEAAPGNFPVQVVTVVAKQQDLPVTIKSAGTLQARQAIDVVARSGGRIEAIGASEGATAPAGSALFDIEYVAAAAEWRRAEAAMQLAKTTYDRALSLAKAGAIPEQDLDRANADFAAASAAFAQAKERLADARIVAPFTGRIGSFSWSLGQIVAPGTVLARLVNHDPLELVFHVAERYAGQLKPGQVVRIRSVAYPDRDFLGDVYFVAPEVEIQTRTLEVKANVNNPDEALRPGMLVDIELTVAVLKNAILIPEASLVRDVEGTHAFVVAADNSAEKRPVVAGVRIPGWVQIASGIVGGERVIQDGLQKVRPGSALVFAEPATAAASH